MDKLVCNHIALFGTPLNVNFLTLHTMYDRVYVYPSFLFDVRRSPGEPISNYFRGTFPLSPQYPPLNFILNEMEIPYHRQVCRRRSRP